MQVSLVEDIVLEHHMKLLFASLLVPTSSQVPSDQLGDLHVAPRRDF